MVEIKVPTTEFYHEKNQPIVIRTIAIDFEKNSITYTYRKDKDGSLAVTGFDVKVYGDSPSIMQSKADQLIRLGVKRMQNPIPKQEGEQE